MHIIFDLDGTLIESLPGIANALNTALTENNLPTHSTSKIRTFIGDGSHTLCSRAAINESTSTIDKIHDSFLIHYNHTWKNGTQIYPGIIDLLSNLKAANITLSILSNKPHDFTTEIISSIFPPNTFDITLGQQEHIQKKPDPSGVSEILTNLKTTPTKTILIGDSTIDLITARNANIESIAVTWGYHDPHHLASENPTQTVHSVKELTNLLLST